MKRVVYLIEQPLDERNFRRFGIQAWMDRRWHAEVWDLTPWAHRRVWADFNRRGHDLKRFAGYFPIGSWTELKERLRGAAAIRCFVDLTGTGFQSARAKFALRRMGAKRIVCAVGTLPVPERVGTLTSKLATAVSKGPKGAWKSLSTAFFAKVAAPRIPADLAVISGTESMTLARLQGEVIRAHNFDYDIYLELMASVMPKISDECVVFIDQDYCFHLEFTYLGTPAVVTADRYFPAVCDALEAISASLGLHVRIAAHPRASYEQRGAERFFRAFPIVRGRTAEMIKECRAVVCHDSTAIQYAVLFEKPAIFITTDELSRTYEGKSIERVADELGKKPINIDRVDARTIDWQKELAIDRDKYASYRNKYIKIEGSPDRPLWTIVIDRVESGP